MSEGGSIGSAFIRILPEMGAFAAELAGGVKASVKGAEGEVAAASAGMKMAALGVVGGVAAIGVASVKMAGDFQQNTNVLVTAAGESQKNLGLIRSGILNISKGTGTSWQSVTEGIYGVEKAGFRGKDALDIMKTAAQGAREEGANLGTVGAAMTSIMASYHLKASDSVSVMNQMKTAAGESKTTMEQFAGSLSKVLPLASANKISFADIGGSLASLTQHGTSADEAAQELANTMRGLSAPNMVAVREMSQLGISSQDVSQKLGDGPGGRGLAGTLDYLSKTVLSKMGPSGKVLLDTFNVSKAAAADATAMISKMAPATQELAKQFQSGSITSKDWTASIKTMPVDQANLAKQFAVMENRAGGFNSAIKAGLPGSQTYTEAIKKMTGGANGLNTTLQLTGESSKGTHERIAAISKSAKDAGKDVEGWDSTQKLLNVRMDQWKQTIEAAAISLGMKLIPVVTKVMDWVSTKLPPALDYLRTKFIEIRDKVVPVFEQYILPVIQKVGDFLEAHLKPILIGAGIAFALLTAPVTSVAVALIYAYEKSATFRQIVAEVVTFIETQVIPVVKKVADYIVTQFGHFAAYVESRMSAMQEAVRHVINATKDVIQAVVTVIVFLWRKFGDDILSVVKTAFTLVKQTVSNLIRAVRDVIDIVLDLINGDWGKAWKAIKDLVKTVLTELWDIVKAGISLVGTALHAGMTAALTVFRAAWDAIKTAAKDAVSWLIGKVKELPGDITSALGNMAKLLYQAGKDVVQGLINGIKDMAGQVGDAVKGMAGGALSTVKHVFGIGSPSKVMHQYGVWVGEGLKNGVMESIPQVERAAQLQAEKAVRATQTALDKELRTFDQSKNKMDRAGQTIVNQLANGMRTGFSNAADILSTLTTDLTSKTFSGEGSKFTQFLKKDTSLLQGLVSTRASIADKLKSAQEALSGIQGQESSYESSLSGSLQSGASIATDATDSGSLVANLQGKLNGLSSFNAQIQALKAQGLNVDTLSQIAGDGVGTGSVAAGQLLSGGGGSIGSINAIQEQIKAQSASLAASVGSSIAHSDTWGKGGIDAAQALVDGFTSDQAVNDKKIADLGTTISKGLKDQIAKDKEAEAAGAALVDQLVKGVKKSGAALTKAITDAANGHDDGKKDSGIVKTATGLTINGLTVTKQVDVDTFLQQLDFYLTHAGKKG